MEKKGSNLRIDEIAASVLDEEKLNAFLDFYDFLSKNKLGKRKTGRSISSHSWAITYKNQRIGGFAFHGNAWTIIFFNLFPSKEWFARCEKYLTVELKDIILANIDTTSSCCVKGICNSVESPTILGKMFNCRVCACGPIKLLNPDGKTLEYAKELALIGKSVITE